MAQQGIGYVYNRNRQIFLATELTIANTHWTRLRGLLSVPAAHFHPGKALWIVPCRGVHTFAMSYSIDVLFLDTSNAVIHCEEKVRPWRVTAMRVDSASILELPANMIFRTGTQVGDLLEISFHADSIRESA